MAHFFFADPHFGHDKVIQLCNRPFAGVEEMNAAMLKNLQAQVTSKDDLWIIGDFAWRGAQQEIWKIFNRIPGNKHLIRGNHDHRSVQKLGWGSIHDLHELRDGDDRFVLCHYPMITWNHARRGAVQIFGHVHDNWPGSRNSVNAGVDLWDFKPVTGAEIKARAASLPVNPIWQFVEPGADLP